LRNSFREPWTSHGFRASWGKAFDKAKLGDADLHFHDLRGTAVTRLALSGCTTPQIAAITGHSPRDVDEILRAHYLGEQADLAEQAIVKLVAAYIMADAKTPSRFPKYSLPSTAFHYIGFTRST
jgi:integrase